MFWVRIDNRLVHGQVIEAWLPFTGAETLVVANDELAADLLRQEIMGLAIPQDISVLFTTIVELPGLIAQMGGQPNSLILFATCGDARRAFDAGLRFSVVNIGNLHYAPGKKQVCSHVAVSLEDERCLGYLAAHKVALDYRCVPSDPVQVKTRW